MDITIVNKKDPEIIAKLNRDVQEKHLQLFPNSFKEYDYASVSKATNHFLKKKNVGHLLPISKKNLLDM